MVDMLEFEKYMKTSIALGVSIIMLALGVQTSRADLIINGSFETPIAPPGSVVRFDSSNPSAMPGWLVSGQIEIVAASVFGVPFDGGQWVDLNGEAGPGGITQSFTTVVGGNYQLTFAYANNVNADQAAGQATIVGIAPLLQYSFDHLGSTVSDPNYQIFTGTFIADSELTTLTIESTSPGSSGIALDAVSVEAVPEPASSLLVLTFVSVLLLTRSLNLHRLWR
jgi:hypothetical protein